MKHTADAIDAPQVMACAQCGIKLATKPAIEKRCDKCGVFVRVCEGPCSKWVGASVLDWHEHRRDPVPLAEGSQDGPREVRKATVSARGLAVGRDVERVEDDWRGK